MRVILKVLGWLFGVGAQFGAWVLYGVAISDSHPWVDAALLATANLLGNALLGIPFRLGLQKLQRRRVREQEQDGGWWPNSRRAIMEILAFNAVIASAIWIALRVGRVDPSFTKNVAIPVFWGPTLCWAVAAAIERLRSMTARRGEV